MKKTVAIVISLIFLGTISSQANAFFLNRNNLSDKNLEAWTDKIFDMKIKTLMICAGNKAISTCIIKNDSVVWSKSYGTTDVRGKNPATNKTIYLISSVTKAITTTALLQLYEQGKFDLDDDVNNYLPFSLRNPNYSDVPITFRMLLSHRASIWDHFLFSQDGQKELIIDYLTTGLMKSPYPWLKEVLVPGSETYQKEYWLDYPPGEDVMYSNTGFLVLAYLLEIISGQTVEDYCQEHIFKPLEMNDTSYHLEGLDENRVIRPYFRLYGIFISIKSYDLAGFAGMCGVRTTIEDLSHFLIAHMNNGTWREVSILNNTTIETMHSIQYYDKDGKNLYDYRYGLGWFETDMFGQTMEGHGGKNFGFCASMMMNRTSKTGFICLLAGRIPYASGIFKNVRVIKAYIGEKAREKLGELLLKKAEEL